MTGADNVPLWEDGHPVRYPPLPGPVEADVCVVGLGGTSLTAVRECLDLGLGVVGVEAGTIGGGAAGRNGGLLLAGVATFHHEAAAALGRDRARQLYECTLEQISRITEETPSVVRLVGSLRLATTPAEEEDCLVHLTMLREDGLPAADYRGPEGVGLLIPSDGAYNPLHRCRLLARQLTDRGATLHEQTPALAVTPGAVETPFGVIRAGAVIVAVDGRLATVMPTLAPRIRTARLQMLGTAPAPEVRIPRPVYARYGMEYWQQLPGGEVALGGFRDLGGDEEWTDSTAPSGVIQDALEDLLRNGLRVQAPITHRWAASVTYHDGILPILEEVGPGLWAMGAYNGTGNVVGALCARAAVQLAAGNRSEVGRLLGAVRVKQ